MGVSPVGTHSQILREAPTRSMLATTTQAASGSAQDRPVPERTQANVAASQPAQERRADLRVENESSSTAPTYNASLSFTESGRGQVIDLVG